MYKYWSDHKAEVPCLKVNHWFWFVWCEEHHYLSAELRARASGAGLTWLNYGRGWNKTPRPKHIPLRAPGLAGNVCTSPLLSLQSKSYLNQITKYPDAVLLMPPFVCSVFASFAFLHHFSRGLCPFFPAHLRCWFRSHTFEGDILILKMEIFCTYLESTYFFSGSLSFIGCCSCHTSANNFCSDSVGMKVWPADTFVARRLAPWLLHSDPCTCNPSQSYPYPAEAVLRSLFNRYQWNPWELKINSLKTGAKLDLNGFEERLCSCSMHLRAALV